MSAAQNMASIAFPRDPEILETLETLEKFKTISPVPRRHENLQPRRRSVTNPETTVTLELILPKWSKRKGAIYLSCKQIAPNSCCLPKSKAAYC